jgi:uncharacterized protein YeaC (DUF1315 family)
MIEEKPGSIAELVAAMSPAIYQNLKQAIELGKWESGETLSTEQTEYCLQAIIAYESKYVELENRIGYIEKTGTNRTPCADTPATIASDRNADSTDEVSK